MRKEIFTCDKCGATEEITHGLEQRPGVPGSPPTRWVALAVNVPHLAITYYGCVHLCPDCKKGFPNPRSNVEYEPTMREYILDILAQEGYEPSL